MNVEMWASVAQELQLWRNSGHIARLWLRDDDAITPTPALDQLIAFSKRFHIPILLAIIPKGADTALAERLAREEDILPAQHGFSHRNHAPSGEKPQELGLHRGAKAVLEDLERGHAKLAHLFGNRLRPVLVPPWNRIDTALIDELPTLGFAAYSTFSEPGRSEGEPARLDCHIDIIDWKFTRSGHPLEKLVAKLATALAIARAQSYAPVGILAHHLVHGPNAWAFLQALGDFVGQSQDIGWVSFDQLLNERHNAP